MRRGGVNRVGLTVGGLAAGALLAFAPGAAQAALTDDLCIPSGDPQLARYPSAAELQRAAALAESGSSGAAPPTPSPTSRPRLRLRPPPPSGPRRWRSANTAPPPAS